MYGEFNSTENSRENHWNAEIEKNRCSSNEVLLHANHRCQPWTWIQDFPAADDFLCPRSYELCTSADARPHQTRLQVCRLRALSLTSLSLTKCDTPETDRVLRNGDRIGLTCRTRSGWNSSVQEVVPIHALPPFMSSPWCDSDAIRTNLEMTGCSKVSVTILECRIHEGDIEGVGNW